MSNQSPDTQNLPGKLPLSDVDKATLSAIVDTDGAGPTARACGIDKQTLYRALGGAKVYRSTITVIGIFLRGRAPSVNA